MAPVGPAKKGALKRAASYELWYADLSEFSLWPHLARTWMRRGRQRTVPTPGKNRKWVGCAALRYRDGHLLWCTQPRRTVHGMRELVRRLLRRARRTGRRIVLVLDTGSPNHAKALARDLARARPWLKVFWLPRYCWELNLIERLWKHLKATRLANVLMRSVRQFRRQVHRALEDFARHPDLNLSIVTRSGMPRQRKYLTRGT